METSHTSLGERFLRPVDDPDYDKHLRQLDEMCFRVFGFKYPVTISGFTSQVLQLFMQVIEEGRGIERADIQRLRGPTAGPYELQRDYSARTDPHSLEDALEILHAQLLRLEHRRLSVLREFFRRTMGKLLHFSSSLREEPGYRRQDVLSHLEHMLQLIKEDISVPSAYT